MRCSLCSVARAPTAVHVLALDRVAASADRSTVGGRRRARHLERLIGALGENPDSFLPFLTGVHHADNLAIATGLDRRP